MENIEARKNKIAQVTGVDRVQQVRIDTGKMLNNGLLIDVDLHGFSCLKARVSWEELGIRTKDKRRDRMSTGTKYLAPAKYVKKLTSLEVRFRQCLDRYSWDVDGLKPWRWMPFTAYDAWQEDWIALKAELNALKAEIVAAYDNIQDQNRRYYEQVSQRAWRAYQAAYDGEAVVVTDDGIFETYEGFEDHIVDTALAKLPRPEFIQHNIYPDYRTGTLTIPQEMLAVYAQNEKAQAEAEKAKAEAKAAWNEQREKDMELQKEELTLRAKAQAIRQAELEHARAQLAQMVSPLDEVMLQFRQRIFESVTRAAKSIQRNGHLRGKTAEMLSGLNELYQTLASATGDDELEQALGSLQNALTKAPADREGKYDIGAVTGALNTVTAITEDATAQLERAAVQETVAGLLELD